MGDIDWASVFGTLESSSLPSDGRPPYPPAGPSGSYAAQQPNDVPRAHAALQAQNAEAGPSRPHPPSRSHSMPGTAGVDDSAYSLFAHDHASRAWFANHAETGSRHSVAGPSSYRAAGQSHDGFAVPHVPQSTPAPLTQLDHLQASTAAPPFLAHLDHGHGLPFLFGQAVQTPSHTALPGANAGLVHDSPDDAGGLVAMSRPPSTPASARPTPNAVLDQEDKRMRNTMASAKFRAKKKQQTEEMQRTVHDLESQKAQLEKDVTSLKQENGLLREIVQLKYGWKVDSDKDKSASRDEGKQRDT